MNENLLKRQGGWLLPKNNGEVLTADSKHISIKTSRGVKRHDLEVFTLAGSAYSFANHQRPIVSPGDVPWKKVMLLQIRHQQRDGDLAIGKNLRVAFPAV